MSTSPAEVLMAAWPNVVHMLQARGLQLSDAEDVAQDALEKCLKRIAQEPDRDFHPGYFNMAARTTLIDRWRVKREFVELDARYSAESQPMDEGLTLNARVLRAAQLMTKLQRDVIAGYARGDSVAEIAGALGVSACAVKKLASRARSNAERSEAEADDVA